MPQKKIKKVYASVKAKRDAMMDITKEFGVNYVYREKEIKSLSSLPIVIVHI